MKSEVRLADGMEFVIPTLAGAHTLAVVSSTPSWAIQEFLTPHDLLHHFSDILGADVHTSKVEKMRMIFEKHAATAAQCVFVTDTLGDMREAKEHDMGAIGCSWGVHPHETLEKGIPFRIVDHPRELPDAVDDYFAR
jgi:phosphoglycolate phosphatase